MFSSPLKNLHYQKQIFTVSEFFFAVQRGSSWYQMPALITIYRFTQAVALETSSFKLPPASKHNDRKIILKKKNLKN